MPPNHVPHDQHRNPHPVADLHPLHILHVALGYDALDRISEPQRAQIASGAQIFGDNIHIQVDQQRGDREFLNHILIDLVQIRAIGRQIHFTTFLSAVWRALALYRFALLYKFKMISLVIIPKSGPTVKRNGEKVRIKTKIFSPAAPLRRLF